MNVEPTNPVNGRGPETVWRVVVTPWSARLDARGRDVLADIRRAGFEHVRAVRSCRVYVVHGDLDRDTIDDVAQALLCDPVSETWLCAPDTPELAGPSAEAPSTAVIEVHYQPGVMDPVALSAKQAINERIVALAGQPAQRVNAVRTAWRYTMDGTRNAGELDRIARGVLANDCIEEVYVHGFGRRDRRPVTTPDAPRRPFELRTLAIRSLDGPGLERASRRAHLFLSRTEMEAIRDRFRGLEREPTDLELETLAQTWSEHCVHKTLKSSVIYRGDDFGRAGKVEARCDNLLKSTIARATEELNRDWCLSVFEDNAGVIAFNDDYGIAFKVETHNHPSAIEPYGGAATGVGGCIRDIMGCGLGARPIASTNVFCVAPPDYPRDRLPRGVLHPARVLKGVVAGVRDYGNRMGIPTVNGAVYFDKRYLANPLVFCGCVGLIPRDRIHKEAKPGDRIVLVGGRTGRDGIHGATFSSAELTEDHADEFSHAVQIGNPIEQKKVLDALLQARDHPAGRLFTAITDCGAGGLSSAVGEMGAELGAVVDLENVPLKYAGLRYDEIWISEAQERMVLAVPPERLDALRALCQAEDVEASVIGTFTDDRRLVVRYNGTVVGDLDMRFLHEGLPQATRAATWTAPHPGPKRRRGNRADCRLQIADCGLSDRESPPSPTPERRLDSTGGQPVRPTTAGSLAGASGSDQNGPYAHSLLDRLCSYTVSSKEWIIRQYDHEVQGGSVIKPLCGPGDGPGDAAVLRPLLDGWRGIAVGCGLCPHVSDDDPYWMAVLAVDEALRNVICVGADPARVAILDNFCWGGCDTPEAMGALVRACQGAYDAAVAYGLPYISGKDSLSNQFSHGPAEAQRLGLPEKIVVPGTLLISAIGIVEDVRRCVTPDLKRVGNPLALVASPPDRLGLDRASKTHMRVSKGIRSGRIAAAHDVSDGGLAVTVAEMCIASRLGARIDLDEVYGSDTATKLFEEHATAYVLECASDDEIRRVGGVKLGEVTEGARLVVTQERPAPSSQGSPAPSGGGGRSTGARSLPAMADGGNAIIDINVATLADAWRGRLTRKMGGDQ